MSARLPALPSAWLMVGTYMFGTTRTSTPSSAPVATSDGVTVVDGRFQRCVKSQRSHPADSYEDVLFSYSKMATFGTSAGRGGAGGSGCSDRTAACGVSTCPDEPPGTFMSSGLLQAETSYVMLKPM